MSFPSGVQALLRQKAHQKRSHRTESLGILVEDEAITWSNVLISRHGTHAQRFLPKSLGTSAAFSSSGICSYAPITLKREPAQSCRLSTTHLQRLCRELCPAAERANFVCEDQKAATTRDDDEVVCVSNFDNNPMLGVAVKNVSTAEHTKLGRQRCGPSALRKKMNEESALVIWTIV